MVRVRSGEQIPTPQIHLNLISILPPFLRKLEKAVALRNSLLEGFSGKFRRWSSGSTKCYLCQRLGTFRQGKWLLENRPLLRERSWIFSSETATAFLSFPQSRTTVYRSLDIRMQVLLTIRSLLLAIEFLCLQWLLRASWLTIGVSLLAVGTYLLTIEAFLLTMGKCL